MNYWESSRAWVREALGELGTNVSGHPPTVRGERNVEEWPVFGLGRAKGDSQSREHTSTIVGEDGSELKQRLEVSAPGKYRLPGRFDYDVYSAVLELLEIRGGMPEDGTLRFSIHELILIMGVEPSGRTYEEVKRSLRRIAATVLESDNAFWSKGQQRHISDTFHMWSVRFDSVTDKNGSGSRHEIEFGKLFRRSFAEQYLRGLDIGFFWALDSPVAKRLYRLVDLKRDGAASWDTDLFDLQDLIPIGPYAYVSKIKEKLSAAHEELIERGFLSAVRYKGKTGVEYSVSAAFVDRRKGLELAGTREDYIAIKLLTESGLRGDVARDLVAKHGPAHCTRYANAIPHQKNLRNPAGWLRRAIEEGYDLDLPTAVVAASASRTTPATTDGTEPTGEAVQETLPPAALSRAEATPYYSPLPDRRTLELWSSVLEDLAASTDSPGLRAWFEGTIPVSIDDQTLILSVPNPLAEEYIASRFKEGIERLLKERLSDRARLRLEVSSPTSDG